MILSPIDMCDHRLNYKTSLNSHVPNWERWVNVTNRLTVVDISLALAIGVPIRQICRTNLCVCSADTFHEYNDLFCCTQLLDSS